MAMGPEMVWPTGCRQSDLLPSIRRKVYMILRNEEECDVEGKAQRSGDDRGVEADGVGTIGRAVRRGPKDQVAAGAATMRWLSTLISRKLQDNLG